MAPLSVINHRNNNSSPEKISKREKKEILYDGYFFDVTDFINRHPGGKIIEMYTKEGEDATLAIRQFHRISIKKVQAIMTGLKKRPAAIHEICRSPETLVRHQRLTEDFQKLHYELEAEGFFEPSKLHVFYRITEVVLLGLLSLYLVSLNNSLCTATGILFFAFFHGRSGYLFHEAGHRSLTGYPKIDAWVEAIFSGVGCCMAPGSWSSQHNRHHAMTQRLQHDVDLETMPLIAFNAKVVRNPERDGKSFFVQNQRLLFLTLDTFLVTTFWKLYLHPRTVFVKRTYSQLIFMALHWVMAYYLGWGNYIIASWLASSYMLGNFSLSHTHFPVNEGQLHWTENALSTTTDIEPNWWCDWWMGYLNYQVEHHLFPQMPQFRNRYIRKRVMDFAKKHEIPYHCMSYWEAVQRTSENLAKVSTKLKCGKEKI